jgi:hypothetical protein
VRQVRKALLQVVHVNLGATKERVPSLPRQLERDEETLQDHPEANLEDQGKVLKLQSDL